MVELVRAGPGDSELLWNMQVEAFAGLLERYQDYETNPGNETRERVEEKLLQDSTYFYFIFEDGCAAGAVRVVDKKDGSRKRIAPLFIKKQYRNRGLAQMTFHAVEKLHGSEHWKLDTILQEKGNCHLYEKMGYIRTGVTEKINEKMDIVYYEKN